MVVDTFQSALQGWHLRGKSNGVTVDSMLIQPNLAFINRWMVDVNSIVVVILGPAFNAALGLMEPEWNDQAFNVPVSFVDGPSPAPEYIEVTPLRWFEASTYPWLG